MSRYKIKNFTFKQAIALTKVVCGKWDQLMGDICKL